MSSFSVVAVALDDVLVHENADALEIAIIGGYQAVVQKGLHKRGDVVIYIPEAAVLPDTVITAMGLDGRLSGSDKNRVKAIRLRGALSQGLVMPLSVYYSLIGEVETVSAGEDVTEKLGIIKWEPPVPVHLRGTALPRPDWFPYYTDIENWKKYPHTFGEGDPVIMTEKIHGTNFGVGMHRDTLEMMVSSRRLVLKADAENLYWRVARGWALEQVLRNLLMVTEATSVIIWGEIFGSGVQDLTYGAGSGQIFFRWFDLMVDGEYIEYDTAMVLLDGLPMVPIVYRGAFDPIIMQAMTEGKTAFPTNQMREGVVMRPEVEMYDAKVGRVILKSISPQYLLRKSGTEYN